MFYRFTNELRSSTPILISNCSPQSSETTLLSFDDQNLSEHETEQSVNQVESDQQIRQSDLQINRLDNQTGPPNNQIGPQNNQIGHLNNRIGQPADSIERSLLLGEVVVAQPPPPSSSSLQLVTNLSPASRDYQPKLGPQASKISRPRCCASTSRPLRWR